MALKVNKELILWGLAVLQPASAEDVYALLSILYSDDGPIPGAQNIQQTIERLQSLNWVNLVHSRSKLYSITEKGNERLPKKLRYLRDKTRIFLLKAARSGRFQLSEEVVQELSGASPGVDVSSSVKEVARPVGSAARPHGHRGALVRPCSRAYWPRLLEQLDSPVGLTATSSDIRFSYYSFASLASINEALFGRGFESDLDASGLALAIGVSPRLVGFLMTRPHRHYRQFEIGKRGGGIRVIQSPRVFLKTIQSWLNDYLLWRLPYHADCHSYKIGKSIISNAKSHVGKKFVGNIDIKNFFGSITTAGVAQLLTENGFGSRLAHTVSRLTTLNNSLPQGAPTSPAISNAFLFRFDTKLSAICREASVTYSRYADDITISGESKEMIERIIQECSRQLNQYGLQLNDGKTRIASQGGQQRVTGVVVNEVLQPPRKLRREIRAMFHHAQLDLDHGKENLPKLKGYLSYLNSFPHLCESNELSRYRETVKTLSS